MVYFARILLLCCYSISSDIHRILCACLLDECWQRGVGRALSSRFVCVLSLLSEEKWFPWASNFIFSASRGNIYCLLQIMIQKFFPFLVFLQSISSLARSFLSRGTARSTHMVRGSNRGHHRSRAVRCYHNPHPITVSGGQFLSRWIRLSRKWRRKLSRASSRASK